MVAAINLSNYGYGNFLAQTLLKNHILYTLPGGLSFDSQEEEK